MLTDSTWPGCALVASTRSGFASDGRRVHRRPGLARQTRNPDPSPCRVLRVPRQRRLRVADVSCVRAGVLRGVRRSLGAAQAQKDALSIEQLRALVLLGFAAALRRSELVALAVEDLVFEPEGVTLRLRRSKTNQVGAEEVVPVLYGSDPMICPVRTLRLGLDAAGIRQFLKARASAICGSMARRPAI
jgi:integrase